MNGKIYFNGIKKEICLHQLFSKLHNYFSTKSPRTSIHFHQRRTSFSNPSQAFHFVCCHSNLLPQFTIFELPYPASYCTHINTMITINGLHFLWISIGGTLSVVKNSITAHCLNGLSENSSISMCSGWGL